LGEILEKLVGGESREAKRGNCGITGIFLMSDGLPTADRINTSSEFKTFVERNTPTGCYLSSLGFGLDYNADIMEAIGTFQHVEKGEGLPVAMALTMQNFLDTVGTGCVVTFPAIPGDRRDLLQGGEPLVIAGDSFVDKVGRMCCRVGTLFTGQSLSLIYLPFGHAQQFNLARKLRGARLSVSYVDLNGKDIIFNVDINVPVKPSHLPLEDYPSYYFWISKKYLIETTAAANDSARGLQEKKEIIQDRIRLLEKFPSSLPDLNISNKALSVEDFSFINEILAKIVQNRDKSMVTLKKLLNELRTKGTIDKSTFFMARAQSVGLGAVEDDESAMRSTAATQYVMKKAASYKRNAGGNH
jgi:hypothetical protein